jgi:hypothetical protein
MTRRLRLAALLSTALATALLGGCGMHHHHRHQPPAGGGSGDPAAPQVLVSNGAISVDQEVLRFGKDQVNVRITWRLQGRGTGKLSFPPNGVVFERAAQGEIVECQRSKDNTEFSCINRHSKPGIYRYGINVDEDGQPLKPLDPTVMND